jgi:hypothetical protein
MRPLRHVPFQNGVYATSSSGGYSTRSALTGSIDAARFAPESSPPRTPLRNQHANRASHHGRVSTPVISNNCAFTIPHCKASRLERRSPSPIPVCSIAPRITIPTTKSARRAPSAMRMPISGVRRTTVYAVTPYSPIAASSSASAPNSSVSLRDHPLFRRTGPAICCVEGLELHHRQIWIDAAQRVGEPS